MTTLVSRQLSAGWYSMVWEGRDSNGRQVASGVYIYQLRAKDFIAQKKLVFTK